MRLGPLCSISVWFIFQFISRSTSLLVPPINRACCHTRRTHLFASQLKQIASYNTVISIDTGDLDVISELVETCFISDATTNPLFVSQAGLSGDPRYERMVTTAVNKARNLKLSIDETVSLSIDQLSVNLGVEILKCGIQGYNIFYLDLNHQITELNLRLHFDRSRSKTQL